MEHQHHAAPLSWENFLSVLQHTLMITLFVLVVMLMIEYITVQTHGKWSKPLGKSRFLQIIVAAALGLIPGCLGGFTSVSLYLHRTFNFAALLTSMLSTTGDEAFVMFSMFPGKALILNIYLLVISVVTGLAYYLVFKDKSPLISEEKDIQLHDDEPDCICWAPKMIVPQLRKITFTRALLIAGGLLFMLHLFTTAEFHQPNGWEKATYVIVTVIGLFIVTTVPDHFLNEHLWKHTIKRHIPRIFIWTLIAFLIIDVFLAYFDLDKWISSNTLIMLVLALLIGIIPQSGPHIIFVTLFASGSIPFSVLMANSVVQDGHGAIPLLAESPRSFIMMKAIKLSIGILAGVAGLLLGF
jgi:hypothetical protein